VRASKTDTLSQIFASSRILAAALLIARRMKNWLDSSVVRQVEKFCFAQNFAVRSLRHWPWAVRAELTGCSAPLGLRLDGFKPDPLRDRRTRAALVSLCGLLVAVLSAAVQLSASTIQPPVDQTARAGGTIVLQVQATGDPALV
jgi:hypothetical protein